MTYSVAIRTLGTGGDNYRRELESLARQTVKPERITVYLAEGYTAPDFRIAGEEYVYAPKGMVPQRAQTYAGITSDCLLLLDDDVELEPDAVEKMLRIMDETGADCVAADTFRNHCMTRPQRLVASVGNLVYPSRRQKKAFRLRRCGAFSYLSRPQADAHYPSDCAAGPCSLWRREAFLSIRYSDEMWLEADGFAYAEDTVMFHKLVANGGTLRVLFGNAATHLNSGTSSGLFRHSDRWMYVRTKNTFITWWRCIYSPAPSALTALCYAGRAAWGMLTACALLKPAQYLAGLRDGARFVRSDDYKSIPPYRLP